MKKLHFIGIGGIGMSGLAAMAQELGYTVSGSDRGAERPENRRIFSALISQGIKIYPQDGSFFNAGAPDFLVYSTAIEEDNPDFAAAGATPRLHRSALIELLLKEISGKLSIAVTGSCGKSTVTAYMAEALCNLDADPSCLNGALSKRFKSQSFAGNFRPGKGKYFVFEADESDKSLLNYQADYAIILNIGTDHYSKEELAEVFGKFLQNNVRRGVVIEQQVYEAVKAWIPPQLQIAVFSDNSNSDYALEKYGIRNHRAYASFAGTEEFPLPLTGRHNALNALAVFAMLRILGFEASCSIKALQRFDGIFRRTDFAGKTRSGALVYDDYAHNPEKIISCLHTMRELGNGRVIAVFQPHGYGPLGFMQDALFEFLEKDLQKNDIFIMMEPYYAGGTTSFRPSAESVIAQWKDHAKDPGIYHTFSDRETLTGYLLNAASDGDVIVIMGARDNSLSDYASSLTLS